jgi:hypothetical protein
MKRTQIYIDEKTYSHLENESKIKGSSISEIIRQSVRERLNRGTQKLLRSVEEVFGIWKDRKFDVDEYIRSGRKDRDL